jgi:hypothetical protein
MAELSYSTSTTCGNQCEASYRIYVVAWKDSSTNAGERKWGQSAASARHMVTLTQLHQPLLTSIRLLRLGMV